MRARARENGKYSIFIVCRSWERESDDVNEHRRFRGGFIMLQHLPFKALARIQQALYSYVECCIYALVCRFPTSWMMLSRFRCYQACCDYIGVGKVQKDESKDGNQSTKAHVHSHASGLPALSSVLVKQSRPGTSRWGERAPEGPCFDPQQT